jgi:hypothetical protein
MNTHDLRLIGQAIIDVCEQRDSYLIALVERDAEIKQLREALQRKQRPEAETIDGVIEWIKEDADRLAIARAALGEDK